MEISILAVNCRTFRFNRPCADGPFGSSRDNPPQRGAGTLDEPLRTSVWAWEARRRPVPLHDATGIWKRLCMPREAREITNVAEGCRRPTSILLTSYLRIATHWASLKKQSTGRLLEYVFQANVKTNKIVCDSKTTRVQEDTDISLSELDVT